MTEFDKEAFIEAVRMLRSLWDVNCSSYKDRNVRSNAWKKLAAMFGKDGMYIIDFNLELFYFITVYSR